MDDHKPTRRDFIRTVGSATLAAPLCAAAGGQDQDTRRRPNVVLVMTDDQGYGDLACHGDPLLQTPNLDALHGSSVRLTDFHVAPTCSPTRAGLMTGRYCNRTGVWHTIMGRSILRGDEITMGDVFTAAGYQTGIFGKWHLGDNYPARPQDKGFQEVLIHGGGGVGQTPDYWGNDYFDDTYWRNGKPTAVEGYCTDVFFDAAMEFIETNQDRPFFAYIPTNAAHGPYNVDEKYSDPYREAGVEGGKANFYGMITNIDENMGRLVEKLDELGLADDTILIFMTDNGSSVDGHSAGLRGRKGSEYDGGHRVPFFLRWANGGLVDAGTDIDRLTANVDLLPTFIELCGLKAPTGVHFDGTSIAPLLRGTDDWPDRTLVTDSQRVEHPEKWRKSAVMTDDWRLVNGEELYYMPDDLGQRSDVAGEHPEVVAKLREAYDEWWASVSERFDECCEIVIGSEEENPARLTAHDWHDGQPPWSQGHIRKGGEANGFWAVRVDRIGEYRITLRRWPEEAGVSITGAPDRGQAIAATRARLQIGDTDMTQDIREGATAVSFRVLLNAGSAELRTWFINDAGEERGAYYAYVTRL